MPTDNLPVLGWALWILAVMISLMAGLAWVLSPRFHRPAPPKSASQQSLVEADADAIIKRFCDTQRRKRRNN